LGCAAGLLLEAWAQGILIWMAPATIPRIDGAVLGMRVLAFAVLLSLATGVLFGLAPAWQATRTEPGGALKPGSRTTAGRSVIRWRSAVMLGQVALSMVLLICAGLLLKSFFSLNRVDLGFHTDRVLAMNINLPKVRYPSPELRLAFFENLERRVLALPGVQAAAFANRMPMRGGWRGDLEIERGASPGSEETDLQAVSPGYFQTLGINLLRGRLFTADDRGGRPAVAVVNR